MTFETSAQRTLAYVQSPSMQMRHKISGVTNYGYKFVAVIFFSIFFMNGVNATIRVAIRRPVVG